MARRQSSNPACRCNRPATHQQEARKIRLRFQKKESTKQCVGPNECKANKKTIIDYVERCARTPVRPGREGQQENRDNVNNDSRQHNAETSTFE